MTKLRLRSALVLVPLACTDGGPPGAPDVPASFAAEAVGPRAIRLSWTYTGAVDAFRIERRHVTSQGPTEFTSLTSVDGDARTYVDENLDLARQYDYRVHACRGELCSSTGIASASTENPARTFGDREDDFTGPQVRAMYIVPSDGGDRALDTDGTLARSVASADTWFQQRTGGYSIRFDRHGGALDIGFLRLKESDGYLSSQGFLLPYVIEGLMDEENLLAGDKMYVVYYDGSNTQACGSAVLPELSPGQVGALYLQARPQGEKCDAPFVTSETSPPGYWEFVALHELLHTFGIVSRDAPNHTDYAWGHVPEPNDLMYAGGGAPWAIGSTMTIDVGSDDYFGANVSASLPALERTPYVTAPLAAARAPRSGGERSRGRLLP